MNGFAIKGTVIACMRTGIWREPKQNSAQRKDIVLRERILGSNLKMTKRGLLQN